MFFRHRRVLERFNEELRSKGPGHALGRKVKDLLAQKCPRCKASLTGHRYALLAVTPIPATGNLGGCERLLRAVDAERWRTCAKLSELDLEQDLVEVFLVSCPDSMLSWVAVRSPVEYLETPELVAAGLVSEGGQARLVARSPALSLEWRELGS